MSTILKELRLLEAEYASGAITADELEQRKADLVDDVPEVVALEVNEPEPPGQVHALPGFASWDTLLLWIIGATLSGAFVWMLTADTALALTMGITVLAAMTIKLFLQLED